MPETIYYDTYEDAIRACVASLGGLKRVACVIWPAMPADEACRKLSACLNRDKREKLNLGELQLIRQHAREQGVHTLMNYEAQDAGYSCPLPITPEDKQAELQRQFIDAVGVLDTIQKQLISGTTKRAR